MIGGYSHHSYESVGLRNYVLKYSCELSYNSVSNLIKEKDGTALLSSPRIQQIVIEKGEEISQLQLAKVEASSKQALPIINEDLDLYDSQAEEIHVFEDGIGVRKQKQLRDKSLKTNREWHYTDVILLEQPNGDFKHLVAGFGLELEAILLSELKESYDQTSKALPIVVFSDGATCIRERMQSVFGQKVKRVLDWYHLNKKIWSLMSMIAINKVEKKEHATSILYHLWKGQVKKAIPILEKILTKNEQKRQELINYLDKREAEIINYEKRKEAGKTIGSGRIEKGCDVIVGIRQKGKGKSWSSKGSTALALVKMQFKNEKEL